jgi:hypothetical protein
MPRVCTVCSHPNREEIDRMLAFGRPARRVATENSLHNSAVQNHKTHHLTTRLAAVAQERHASAGSLLDDVLSLHAHALEILKAARDADNHSQALKAIQQATNVLELIARIRGVVSSGNQVTVVNQLGVTLEEAQCAVSLTQRAQALAPRDRAVAAARVLRVWNGMHPEDPIPEGDGPVNGGL